MLINHSVSNELVPQVTYQSLGKRVGMGFEIELVCRYQPLCKQRVSVLVSLVKSGESRSGKSQDPACFCKKKFAFLPKKIETLDSCNFMPTGPILMFLVPRMCSSSWKARAGKLENAIDGIKFSVRTIVWLGDG